MWRSWCLSVLLLSCVPTKAAGDLCYECTGVSFGEDGTEKAPVSWFQSIVDGLIKNVTSASLPDPSLDCFEPQKLPYPQSPDHCDSVCVVVNAIANLENYGGDAIVDLFSKIGDGTWSYKDVRKVGKIKVVLRTCLDKLSKDSGDQSSKIAEALMGDRPCVYAQSDFFGTNTTISGCVCDGHHCNKDLMKLVEPAAAPPLGDVALEGDGPATCPKVDYSNDDGTTTWLDPQSSCQEAKPQFCLSTIDRTDICCRYQLPTGVVSERCRPPQYTRHFTAPNCTGHQLSNGRAREFLNDILSGKQLNDIDVVQTALQYIPPYSPDCLSNAKQAPSVTDCQLAAVTLGVHLDMSGYYGSIALEMLNLPKDLLDHFDLHQFSDVGAVTLISRFCLDKLLPFEIPAEMFPKLPAIRGSMQVFIKNVMGVTAGVKGTICNTDDCNSDTWTTSVDMTRKNVTFGSCYTCIGMKLGAEPDKFKKEISEMKGQMKNQTWLVPQPFDESCLDAPKESDARLCETSCFTVSESVNVENFGGEVLKELFDDMTDGNFQYTDIRAVKNARWVVRGCLDKYKWLMRLGAHKLFDDDEFDTPIKQPNEFVKKIQDILGTPSACAELKADAAGANGSFRACACKEHLCNGARANPVPTAAPPMQNTPLADSDFTEKCPSAFEHNYFNNRRLTVPSTAFCQNDHLDHVCFSPRLCCAYNFTEVVPNSDGGSSVGYRKELFRICKTPLHLPKSGPFGVYDCSQFEMSNPKLKQLVDDAVTGKLEELDEQGKEELSELLAPLSDNCLQQPKNINAKCTLVSWLAGFRLNVKNYKGIGSLADKELQLDAKIRDEVKRLIDVVELKDLGEITAMSRGCLDQVAMFNEWFFEEGYPKMPSGLKFCGEASLHGVDGIETAAKFCLCNDAECNSDPWEQFMPATTNAPPPPPPPTTVVNIPKPPVTEKAPVPPKTEPPKVVEPVATKDTVNNNEEKSGGDSDGGNSATSNGGDQSSSNGAEDQGSPHNGDSDGNANAGDDDAGESSNEDGNNNAGNEQSQSGNSNNNQQGNNNENAGGNSNAGADSASGNNAAATTTTTTTTTAAPQPNGQGGVDNSDTNQMHFAKFASVERQHKKDKMSVYHQENGAWRFGISVLSLTIAFAFLRNYA